MSSAAPSPRRPDGARRQLLEEILARLPKPVMRTRNGWRSRCPSCGGGSTDKFSVAEGRDGRLLFYCHGGCTFPEIAEALSLERPAPTRARPGPYTLSDAREDAVRRLLAQRWNNADVLHGYRRADEIRARVQYVRAVRQAAIADDGPTWEALADAAHVEDEIRRLETELDAAAS